MKVHMFNVRILALALALVMILGVVPVSVFAAETALCDMKTPPLADGRYTANLMMFHEEKEQRSMGADLFDQNIEIVIEGDTATVTMLIVHPVPGVPEQGVDGTIKNAGIHYGGRQYAGESLVGTDAKMTAWTSNALFELQQGVEYPAQVVRIAIPSCAIQENCLLKFKCYMNVIMMADTTMRMNITNITQAEPQYKVFVENGTGAGKYEAGETVSIRAEDRGEGCTFSHWEMVFGESVDFADPTSPETTFVMPDRNVSIMACYYVESPDFVTEIIPAGRRFVNTVTVRLRAPDSCNIFYTLDGSDPRTNGILYEGSFPLTETTTVRAVAKRMNMMTRVAEAEFIKTEYTDIQGHWGQEYIEYVIDEGLFIGTDDDQFSPERTMDRAMFVTVLGRMADVDPNGSGKTQFTDVPENEWYAPYVAWAVENGITVGKSETTFEPETQVTREEMACFLMRFCQRAEIRLEGGDKIVFDDADEIQSWAVESVDALTRAGLLIGNHENCFKPQNGLTRAEAATVFTRLLTLCVGD